MSLAQQHFLDLAVEYLTKLANDWLKETLLFLLSRRSQIVASVERVLEPLKRANDLGQRSLRIAKQQHRLWVIKQFVFDACESWAH